MSSSNRHILDRDLEVARPLLGEVADGVVVADLRGVVRLANRAAERMFGASVVGSSLSDWPRRFSIRLGETDPICPERRFPLLEVLGGEPVPGRELYVHRPSGPRGLWVDVSACPLTDETGEVYGAIAILRDVTKRKRVEAALDEERRQLSRQHRRQAGLASIHLTAHTTEELDRLLEGIVQVTEQCLPASASSMVIWDSSSRSYLKRFSTIADEGSHVGPSIVRAAGGATRWILEHGAPLTVTDPDHDPFRAGRDDRQLVFPTYAGVPLIDDDEGEALGVLYALEGEPRSYAQHDLDFLAALAGRAASAINKVRLYERLRGLNRTLNDRTAELARHRKHLASLVEERTAELQTSHERLRAADRLASIGTLTAGLGHDISNVLFPIRCRLEVLDWDAVPPDLMQTLRAVSHATEYLQQLSEGLRLFARDPEHAEASAAATDLSAWWHQVSALLRKTLPASIDLKSGLGPDLPPLRVPAHRLTQAVLNLVVNAGEAMPEGGTIRISAGLADQGRLIRLAVSDQGHGMAPEVRRRAFDPFFTTKSRGLSTGLGLSLVHGVVKSSGGTIEVESEPGQGTTIVLVFPAAAEPPAGIDHAASRPRGHANVTLGDARAAAWTARYLEAAGYTVATPDQYNQGRGDAVLWVVQATDENLPLIREFKEGDPQRRVIVVGPGSEPWAGLATVSVDSAEDLDAVTSAIRDVSERNWGAEA